ncbi:MAG: hypothetical protein Q8L87_09070 [Anaerolineales bacterium]|nr:hypothetical protein [Anaerolineales bacterium]
MRARDLDAAGFWHLDIKHGDIRFVFLDERLRLAPAQTNMMVIRQKNADFCF